MTKENKDRMITDLTLTMARWREGCGNPITAAGRAVGTKSEFLAHFKAENLAAWPNEQDAEHAAEFIEAKGAELLARMEKADAEEEKFENYDWEHDPAGLDD